MKNLTQLLSSIGLSQKEHSIYLTCLQYGETSASTLSRMTGIPRASIYDITHRLIKK